MHWGCAQVWGDNVAALLRPLCHGSDMFPWQYDPYRIAGAQEVARVVLFLASDEAGFIVGAAVDGGVVLE
jgi:NAD(P)-dependent dehydrogenase (short-subunit alcohol dehydrogenase family)